MVSFDAQSTDDDKQIKADRSTMITQERSRSDIAELARASARCSSPLAGRRRIA